MATVVGEKISGLGLSPAFEDNFFFEIVNGATVVNLRAPVTLMSDYVKGKLGLPGTAYRIPFLAADGNSLLGDAGLSVTYAASAVTSVDLMSNWSFDSDVLTGPNSVALTGSTKTLDLGTATKIVDGGLSYLGSLTVGGTTGTHAFNVNAATAHAKVTDTGGTGADIDMVSGGVTNKLRSTSSLWEMYLNGTQRFAFGSTGMVVPNSASVPTDPATGFTLYAEGDCPKFKLPNGTIIDVCSLSTGGGGGTAYTFASGLTEAGGTVNLNGDFTNVALNGNGTQSFSITNATTLTLGATSLVLNAPVSGTAVTTVIGTPGADTLIPTEKAVRDAIGVVGYTHPDHTGDVTSVGDGATTITDNVVTNAKLADMAANTVKVRNAGTSGDPVDVAIAEGEVVGRLSGGALGAISNTFLNNTDTPASYAAGNGYIVRVNSGATGLEFIPPGDVFEAINGLSESGAQIKLGGTLGENTTIDGAQLYGLQFNNMTYFNFTADNGGGETYDFICNTSNMFMRANGSSNDSQVSLGGNGVNTSVRMLSGAGTLLINNTEARYTHNAGAGDFFLGSSTNNVVSLGVNINTIALANVTETAGIEVAGGIEATGDIYAAGNVISGSDINLKQDIRIYDQGLSLLESINTYFYKMKKTPGVQRIGVIAQDFAGLESTGIVTGNETTGYGVSYDRLTIPLINAVKELNARVKELESKLKKA